MTIGRVTDLFMEKWSVPTMCRSNWKFISDTYQTGENSSWARVCISNLSDFSSLPQSLFSRPSPSFQTDGHLCHPVGEALIWALALKVAPGVVNQERQQTGHFLLQTGSLLGQPGAESAECGKNERFAISTRIHLGDQRGCLESRRSSNRVYVLTV